MAKHTSRHSPASKQTTNTRSTPVERAQTSQSPTPKPSQASKQTANTSNIAEEQMRASQSPSNSVKSSNVKGRGGRPAIGGTAVPGAKSTQQKEVVASSNPNQQQMDSYNRTMRRRMQHIGAGPYAQDERTQTLQEKRQKTVERRKKRLEERREALRKSLPGGGKVTVGRKNTYFLIIVAVLVVLLILAFVVLRITGILH